MSTLRFEWDEAKNESNLRKHGLGFEEASLVFRDPLHVCVLECAVGGEERWQTFGIVRGMLLLMVAHTGWQDGETEVVRMISARRATTQERRWYERENG